jgi:hypothetical protein
MIQAEPYKTFFEIKQKAINRFMELPNNIHFYYLGQDLNKKEQEKIGTIFNHKEQVTVILRLPKLKLKPSGLSSEIKRNKFSINQEMKNHFSFLNSQNFSVNNKIRNKRNIYNLKFMKSQDFEKKNNEMFYFNKRLNNNNKIGLIKSSSMPNISLKNSNNNIQTKSNRIIKKIKLNVDNNNGLSFCEIHKYRVNEYCRACKKFICPECRLTQEHNKHLTISLNFKNLEDSIKLYILLVITNEKRDLDIIKKNALSDGDEIMDEKSLKQKKNSIEEKCNKLIDNYHLIMKMIEKKLELDKKSVKIMIINTYNDIAQKINKQISEIINKLEEEIKIRKDNLSKDELKYYFDEIAKKEETLEMIGDRTIKYLLTFEINRKIETTLDKIENTLDEMINEDNIFNLENRFSKEIMNINVVQINKEDNNNNNNKERKINKGILKRGQRRNALIFGH